MSAYTDPPMLEFPVARMFLVDGSNHAFRVHFALPPMHAVDGFPTRALYGFTTLFAKLVRVHQPDYVVVAFDSGRTFRHDLFDDYKGHRPDMPEDLRAQWPHLPSLVEGFGYTVLAAEGFEADDVLGTLADRFAGPDLDVMLVTGDKDFGQLVGEHVRILDLMKDQELGPEEIEAKLGVKPGQIADALGLAGDSSDNIPGVPGIGMKTAAKFLQQHGTLDAVLEAARAGEIKGKRGQSLVEHADGARLSRTLATIRTDVPLDVELDDLTPRGMQEDDLRDLFDRWDFGKVARNLLPKRKGLDLSGVRAATDLDDLDGALSAARAAGRVAFGFELSHPDPLRAEVVGVRLAWGDRDAVYVPIAHAQQPFDGAAAWARVVELLEDDAVALVGHHLKIELEACLRLGVRPTRVCGDTMLLDYVLFAHERVHGLDEIAQRLLGHYVRPWLTMEGGRRMGMADESVDVAARYGGEDARLALILHERLYKRLSDPQRFVYDEIELPLLPVLAEMELRGIRLDEDRLAEVSADIDARVAAAELRCHELAGHPFNVASRHELRDILFEELGLPPSKKVKDGWSTDQSVLEKLVDLHPLPAALIEHRSLAKLKSTYLDKLGDYVREDGRIHTSFNQAVAATGRLSSADPNLQNIPVRTDEGRRIRECFVPEAGHVFLSADYSQVELRVLAHYSEEPTLLESFRQGVDIHRRTASEVLGVPLDEVSAEQRSAAKAINFGLLYGMSAFRLGNDLAISRAEADEYMERYFARLPGVRDWIEESKVAARKQGIVETLFGRRRVIPGIHSQRFSERAAAEREAVNTRVQGTAADIIKRAMVRVTNALVAAGLQARLLLQVHDELLLEVPEAEIDAVSALVEREMAAAADLVVPLAVNLATGRTWREAHG